MLTYAVNRSCLWMMWLLHVPLNVTTRTDLRGLTFHYGGKCDKSHRLFLRYIAVLKIKRKKKQQWCFKDANKKPHRVSHSVRNSYNSFRVERADRNPSHCIFLPIHTIFTDGTGKWKSTHLFWVCFDWRNRNYYFLKHLSRMGFVVSFDIRKPPKILAWIFYA